MLRATLEPSRIATLLPLALLAAGTAFAQVELELPAPAEPTSVRAIAVRADLSPRPDSAYQAVVSLTVLNPESGTRALRLDAGPGATVSRAGEPVRLKADGSHEVRLEGSEVAVLTVDRRIAASELAYLAAEDAGWLGAARGPLLQPVRRIRIAHPDGSSFAGSALEVRIDPGGELLACALFASEGAVAAKDGSVSWSFGAGRAPAEVALAWPAIENETFLPIDEREAQVFAEHWQDSRGIEPEAVRLVRSGILVVHGEGMDEERARRAFDPTKRRGWAPIPGPPTRSEREAIDALAAFADRLELGGAPAQVAQAAPRRSAPPPPAPRPTPTPGAAPEEPREEPKRTTPAPREAAQPPSVPPRRRERASERPAPNLDVADNDELVTRAPDPSWRAETLLGTESSVPSTPERARRWARRALRGDHGVSRAVLARESVPALLGKTWGPGYVSEFFSRKPWYRANEDFDMEQLSAEQAKAYEVLDELVSALQEGRELWPEEPEPVAAVAQQSPAAPATRSTPEAPTRTPERTSEPAPSMPKEPAARQAASPPATSGPPVPWLHDPAQARIFLFKEKARGLDRTRVALAIATIEAHHGKPFEGNEATRAYFEGQSWYRPRADYGPEQLSIPAREAITLLRNALDGSSY